MTLALLTMSRQEINRAEWMLRIQERRATQAQVAEHLRVSLRQVERMYRAYKAGGAAALVSKKRGRPSARRLSDALRSDVLRLVRAKYGDFGPTLVREKLVEVHGIVVSVETLRQWMIGDGAWLPRDRKLPRPHPPRARRSCLGELVQIDGCDHDWFEGRALQYHRSLYLVEDTLVARSAAGKLIDVHECEDGAVIFRHGGQELAATAVRKDGHVSQHDVESNKYLARILDQLRHQQLARDDQALRTHGLTLRQKQRLRLDMLRRAGTDVDLEALQARAARSR
jgi:Homeodomain-like domain